MDHEDDDNFNTPKVDEYNLEIEKSKLKPSKKAKEARRLRAELDTSLSTGAYAAVPVAPEDAFDDMKISGLSEEFTLGDAEAAMDDIFGDLDDEHDYAGATTFDEYIEVQSKKKKKGKKRPAQEMDDILDETEDKSKIAKDVVEQKEKGVQSRNQVKMIQTLLNIRIRLQPLMSISNRLPQYNQLPSLLVQSSTQYPEINKSHLEARLSCRSLLLDLITFQKTLKNQNPDVQEKDNAKKLRKLSTDSSVEQIWRKVENSWDGTWPFVDDMVDLWAEKAKMNRSDSDRKFKALDQSLKNQIETTLKDISSGVKKSQLNRLKVKPIGKDEVLEYDQEIYDDNDLYSLLLNDVISSISTAESKDEITPVQKLQVQKVSKNKVQVDRKATKARRLRLETHEKLVNFVIPDPIVVTPQFEALYQGMFGQKNGVVNVAA
eukprot:NODE_3288_length_1381_cov_45.915739_g2858_i0.p1 GENE.NODE_3288_length_1381_cov_45.915739_g2858_i0~~NODE_3288_length_1381_cov_45.915739_g2858_i0.p1  ORF type:complete len:433 (-),score=112.32 NODE_3288_length_1381_cov_45.915739_g2858_i0:21-1319(-)